MPAPPATGGGVGKALSVVAVLLAVAALAINFAVPGPAGVSGAAGAAGANGTNGVDGTDGTNGVACWDLNGNGVPDVATEDRNGDSAVNVADCTGAQGPQGNTGATGAAGANGISCWDLNGNGVPDVATEDRNGDTVVDVLDCQGLSQMRWAHIHGSGTIETQSGGITVIRGGTGFWFVTFPGNDVLNKPVLVSLSRLDGNWPPGTIEAVPCGGPPQGVSCSQSNNINTVLVNIADNAGAGTDWAFYIVVVG